LLYLHLLCLCFVDEKSRNEERLKVVFVFNSTCKLAKKKRNYDADDVHRVVNERDMEVGAMGQKM
jgi:hypothetical protein